jgi:hypothetical protein
MIGIKNEGGATPDLVISQSPRSRIQTYVRKFNPAIYVKRKWLNGRAEKKRSVRPSGSVV